MPQQLEYLDNYVPHRQKGFEDMRYRGGVDDPNWLNLRRPYWDRNGRAAVTVNTGRTTLVKGEQVPILEHVLIRDVVNEMGMTSPVLNATTLRKEEWIELDRRVIKAARFRMRAWPDLAASNTFGGFNGMSKMILEHETMADAGEAIVDMDGLTEGRTDTPRFQLEGLPLPITHSDFWYDSRRLGVSRNSGTPLDMVMGENAGRRVAESIEKVTIGVDTGITYGGNSTQVGGYGRTSAVYGYLNFPPRLTYNTITIPAGTNPEATLNDVNAMMEALATNKFYGPFILYHSTDWTKWLNNDYARAVVGATSIATNMTLRQRLLGIEGIQDVRRLDFLRPTASATGDPAAIAASHAYTMILVQMTSEVCRAVDGMGLTTIQYETVGGMKLNFKVMAINVPQLFADFSGNVGILHGRTA